jgi:hypothetical protein
LSYTRRVCLVWLLAGLAPAIHADETKSAPAKSDVPAATAKAAPLASEDDDFLEFLGSIDTGDADEDWMDYLAQTDIAKVAKAKKKAPAAQDSKASQ